MRHRFCSCSCYRWIWVRETQGLAASSCNSTTSNSLFSASGQEGCWEREGGEDRGEGSLAPNCLGPRVAQSLPSGGAALSLMFSLLKMSGRSASDTVPDLDTRFSRLTWLLCCSPEGVGGRDGHGPALRPVSLWNPLC